jgi:hypothetical protein
MDPAAAAIELTEAAWEQWIGALLRAERLRRLTATARPRRRRPASAPHGPRTRRSLTWMLAISAAGFLLLR